MRDEALASPALATYIDGLWQQFRAWLGADLRARPRSRTSASPPWCARSASGSRPTARSGSGSTSRSWSRCRRWSRSIARGIGRFIEDQINGWQEKKLVEELERHIGPDLQYIRINGTLVGGLAGLAIAAVTTLIS